MIQIQNSTLVEIIDDTLKTTSPVVAESFGKQHKNVLRDIENLECSDEFRRLNFEPSSYLNAQNKEQPMVKITRDGWVILVMGFSGKKATEKKEMYISAFNMMETKLKEIRQPENSRKKILETFRFGKELGAEFGLEENQLLFYASSLTKEETGYDPMKKLGITGLITCDQQVHLNPTELGQRIGGIGPQKINHALSDLNLQTSWHIEKSRGGKMKKIIHWSPTEKGYGKLRIMESHYLYLLLRYCHKPHHPRFYQY